MVVLNDAEADGQRHGMDESMSPPPPPRHTLSALGLLLAVAGTSPTHAESGGGLGGDVDAVFPLAFSAASEASPGAWDSNRRALFLQSGLSTWEDGHAFRRNDLRYGPVHRHALSERPGGRTSSAYRPGPGELGARASTGRGRARLRGAVGVGLVQLLPAGHGLASRPSRLRGAGRRGDGARLDLTTTIGLRAAAPSACG